MHEQIMRAPAKGSWRTMPSVAVVAGTTVAALIGGDGARMRLIVNLGTATTADPETRVSVSTEGAAGAASKTLGQVSPQTPTLILRYEDVGDAIMLPLVCLSNVAAIPISVTPVQWVPEEIR